MNPLLRLALFCLFALLIVRCSNPLHRKYNEKTYDADRKAIAENNKADSSNIGYMAIYVMRAQSLNQKLEDRTYGDILDSAKALRQSALKQLK